MYPQAVLQFLTFLYHNVPDFTTFCSTEEFLTALLGTLFRHKSFQLETEDNRSQEPEEGEKLESLGSMGSLDVPETIGTTQTFIILFFWVLVYCKLSCIDPTYIPLPPRI